MNNAFSTALQLTKFLAFIKFKYELSKHENKMTKNI